jgi:hypothetical protein
MTTYTSNLDSCGCSVIRAFQTILAYQHYISCSKAGRAIAPVDVAHSRHQDAPTASAECIHQSHSVTYSYTTHGVVMMSFHSEHVCSGTSKIGSDTAHIQRIEALELDIYLLQRHCGPWHLFQGAQTVSAALAYSTPLGFQVSGRFGFGFRTRGSGLIGSWSGFGFGFCSGASGFQVFGVRPRLRDSGFGFPVSGLGFPVSVHSVYSNVHGVSLLSETFPLHLPNLRRPTSRTFRQLVVRCWAPQHTSLR